MSTTSASSTFLGIDIDRAPRLVSHLAQWAPTAEATALLIETAERVADLDTGARPILGRIAADGSELASVTEQALMRLQGFRLPLVLPDVALAARSSRTTSVSARSVSDITTMAERLRFEEQAGADFGDTRSALRRALRRHVGDSALDWAAELVIAGTPPPEVIRLFERGPGPVVHTLERALATGQRPEQAGLPAALFPISYLTWHDLDDDKRRIAHDLELVEHHGWHHVFLADSAPASLRSLAWDRVEALDPGHPLHAALERMANPHGRTIVTRDDVATADEFWGNLEADLRQLVDDIAAHQGDLRVSTAFGPTPIGEHGELGDIAAIGAVATTPSATAADHAGRRLAAFLAELPTSDLEHGAAWLAVNPTGATGFYRALGGAATGRLLGDIETDHDLDQAIERTPLTRNLGLALAHASPALGPGFGTAMITANGASGWAPARHRAPAEWLIGDGDFDAAFLIDVAEATLIAWDDIDGLGATLGWHSVDPRSIVLDAVADAELGRRLVRQLGDNDTTRHLIVAVLPIGAMTTGVTNNAPLSPLQRVILEAAYDPESSRSENAAELLIDSLARHPGHVTGEVADAMGQLLAVRAKRHTDDGIESPYFRALTRVFDVGAGLGVASAAHHAAVDDVATATHQRQPHWPDLAAHGSFMATVDHLLFDVLLTDARASDAAIERAESWLTNLTTAASLGLTPLGGPLVQGIGVSNSFAGWLLPSLLDEPDHVEQTLADELLDSFDADALRRQIVARGAVTSGALQFEGGEIIISTVPTAGAVTGVTLVPNHNAPIELVDASTASEWVDVLYDFDASSPARLGNNQGLVVGDLRFFDFVNVASASIGESYNETRSTLTESLLVPPG